MVVIKVGTAPLDCNKTEEVVITPEISVIRLSVITYPPLLRSESPVESNTSSISSKDNFFAKT